MPALSNKVHEEFAQAIASRVKAVDAYQSGHPKASRKVCAEGGSRLKSKPNVAARILELSALSEKAVAMQDEMAMKEAASKLVGTLLTMTDRRRIMSEIANDTEAEDDTRMRAVMNDAKLAGELIDKADLTSDGEALPSAAPVITMTLPGSFIRRRVSDRN